MRLSVDTGALENEIVYLLEIEIDGKMYVKIGITSRKIEERVVEILSSVWTKWRYFPYCRPKRFRKCSNAYEKEQMLHSYFNKYKAELPHKFSGSTEMFDIPIDHVVEVYERVLDGEVLTGEFTSTTEAQP